MSFIISKTSTSHGESRKLYYLVQNYRKGNRIERRTLLKLNDSNDLNDLFEKTLQEEISILHYLGKAKESLKKLLENEKQPYFYYLKGQLTLRITNFETSLEECLRVKNILESHLKKDNSTR